MAYQHCRICKRTTFFENDRCGRCGMLRNQTEPSLDRDFLGKYLEAGTF